ncbi:hypothetical protein PS662_02671 [Pseudomonas fluorescens]|uniref:Autotransporter domain-containing protein n=1 Tax=Pseudomonas fluorescens TaxID=294 RepID=A0A5E6TE80_PSEFL|nr:autotransporter outer membrane beta-barrel domain-containing protein [Pseudomonas fluorescens]VVM87895.1 hypothetical protein PS662_02671 [Pseudomonas fluorescens]
MPVQHKYRLQHLAMAIALSLGCAESAFAETLADAAPDDLITRLDAFISRVDIERTSINKAAEWNELKLDERDDLVSVVSKGASKKSADGGGGMNVLQLNAAKGGSFGDTRNFHALDVTKGKWTASGAGDFEVGVLVRPDATLTNDGTIIGGAITQGTLVNNGSIGGHVFVDEKGTFSGKGAVGSLEVHGQLMVDRKAGAPTVNGDMNLSSKAVLAYEVHPDSSAETIRVAGTASLGGATLKIDTVPGDYPQSSLYTLIEAQKIEGEFGKILHDLAFMDATPQYREQSVGLIYARNDVPIESLATSDNAMEFGKSITEPPMPTHAQMPDDSAMSGGTDTALSTPSGSSPADSEPLASADIPVTAAIPATATNAAITALLVSNKATASMALEQLAGSSNANLAKTTLSSVAPVSGSLLSAMRQLDSAHGSNPMRDAPRQAAGNADTGRVWLQALGHGGKLDRDIEPLQHSTRGLLMGADWSIDEEWRLGVMGGKSRTRLDSRELEGGLDSWHLGAYALLQSGPLSIRLGATYSNHDGTTARRVAFSGFSDRPEGRYDASTQQAFAELGYNLGRNNISIEPFASLGVQRYQRDGYTEKGGAAALKVNEQAKTNMNSTLGLRVAMVDTLSNGMRLTPRFSAGWKHTYGDVFTKTSQRLVTGGRDYTVYGVELDRNSLLVDAGLDLGVSAHHSVGVGLTSDIGSDSRNHGVMGQWRMAF